MFDFITSVVCLMASVFVAAPSCEGTPPDAQGRALLFEDDAGIVALSWDGAEATVYRDSIVVDAYPAESWAEAMWDMQVPAYGTVSAPTGVDHAVDDETMLALVDCRWTAGMRLERCGL